jgi:hydrogenase maturation protein HypF
MGRLFDGVAALLGLHQRVTFEGQAAMALEHCAPTLASDGYRFELVDGDQALPIVLDWAPLIARVLDDLRRGVDRALVAARFHLALTELGVTIAQRTAERTATKQVALSGGCFQNRRLTEQMAQRLRDEGFTMLLHRQVPPNDGCISLGQVMVAAKRISSAARAHGSASPDLLSAHFDNPS